MSFKNKLVISLQILFCTFNIYAQEHSGFPLRIGERMPDILFHTMVNYPGGKAKLSDFAGKPVILDLWHVQCNVCIADMPKMQELQRKFGEKIQIIGFGMNNLNDYNKLKGKSPILKGITDLPLALQADTLLFKKLVGVYPTHIWIDSEGIIDAITFSENATEKNINDFINKRPLKFIMEKPTGDPNSYYPDSLSLMSYETGKSLNYYSLFTSRIDYYEKFGGYLNTGPLNPGVKRINKTFIDLVRAYWGGSINGVHPKIVFKSDNLKKFLVPKNDNQYDRWLQQNSYCYELKLPEGITYSKEYIKDCVKGDIQRFFRVKVERNLHLTDCLILFRLDNQCGIKTKGIKNDEDYDSGITDGVEFKDVPISVVVSSLQSQLSWRREPVSIIDETNYKFNVDIKFDHKLVDISRVRESLKNYGLGLKEESRVIDCIVISEAD